MKNVVLAAVAALLAVSVSAAPVDLAALKAYATQSLAKCPDAKIDVEPVTQAGPVNFLIYAVKMTSSDPSCGKETYLLYSPRTQQVILAAVFRLPADNRPVETKISEISTNILQTGITTTIGKFPLPDGVRPATMTKQTEYGPFAYHGFVDANEQFLMVGTRGNLQTPPGKTLLDYLQLENGVHRGSKTAKTTIVELSDFECPTCGRAHKRIEPVIAKNLSKINYYRLDLPLFEHHEWAIYAALGARGIQKTAPAKYWEYVNYIFENQEAIGKQKFDDVIKNFCEDRDINWKAVEKIYRSPVERAALLDQVSRAFDAGIISTPTYIVNGQILGFGPDGDFTMGQIKKALGLK